MIQILAIGDIVGTKTLEALRERLPVALRNLGDGTH